jgi:ribosomal protein S18 acetylase RimI-like enzyme
MRIIRASHADIDPLVALARRAFFDAYRETDDHAVIEEYCARAFTSERFESTLADLRAALLVARDAESGALVGYAQVGESHPPPCVVGPRPIELARLYLSREWIGRGVGSMLMREAVQAARQLDGHTLWLGVYERNPRAMAFYTRFGMKVVGTKPWEWGGEVFQDPVMACSI